MSCHEHSTYQLRPIELEMEIPEHCTFGPWDTFAMISAPGKISRSLKAFPYVSIFFSSESKISDGLEMAL